MFKELFEGLSKPVFDEQERKMSEFIAAELFPRYLTIFLGMPEVINMWEEALLSEQDAREFTVCLGDTIQAEYTNMRESLFGHIRAERASLEELFAKINRINYTNTHIS